jgi:acetyltransferase-like isoleucine patch superfamily enzyme/acyl carrier protein
VSAPPEPRLAGGPAGPSASAGTADGFFGRLGRRCADAVTRHRLRACTSLGERPVLRGGPMFRNSGAIVIGDDFALSSTPVASHFYVSGKLRVGDRVRIAAGAAVSCIGEMEIEDDVTIGAFAILLDSNFHLAGDVTIAAAPKRVVIGRGARLGHRVLVLPGSTIGRGAVVKAGSVVSGDVPEGAVVEGNPARVRLDPVEFAGRGGAKQDVARLVARVLGLRQVPDVQSGPSQIPEWDSLGALRLVVALEETFGLVLSEDQSKAVKSIRHIVDLVESRQGRSSEPIAT